MMPLRSLFGLLHRWVGLIIAAFLVVSGLTGAVISWDHELDDLLNPHLMEARSSRAALPSLDLARAAEARDPHIRVTFIPLSLEAGKTVGLGVTGRVDPQSGRQFEPGYNELFLDPATGAEQGRRNWGAVWPITRETFVSFLYVLHYSLHIPEMWGIDRWGIWLLGAIAMLWTVDCFFGFYLTLPTRAKRGTSGKSFRERWAPAWKIKRDGSRFRINFDIHRAFGLWLWGLLFMLAFTAFSLNLFSEVFYPALSRVSEVTPTPFDVRTEHDRHHPIEPRLGYADILKEARTEASKRGWSAPAGGVFYSPGYGIYGVGFYAPGDDHGGAGVGPPYLYYDGLNGRLLGDRQPWKGTAADIFVQAQFPLHSGRILGLPGRILISAMGLAVAALSVTGAIIWARKRRARLHRKQKFNLSARPIAQPAE
jgi:uncharacterized iron-regulated membrane protein